ncbi:putative carotenoid cleavage dioxygenase 4, chloroplastic, partial [Cucurbita argyrosperma subsp. argyrosperma]
MDALSSPFLTGGKLLLSPPISTSRPPFSMAITSVFTEETPKTVKRTNADSPSPRRPPPPAMAKGPSTTRLEPSLPARFFNAFDDLINNFINPPVSPSVDPRYVLADNFAPVDELPPTECEVIQGSLPSSLNGAYIRNGPNPQYLPRGPYHLFDGDGMLHSLRISNGRAVLCSRYVKTYKYTLERDAGHPVFPNVFSGFNGLTASAARGAVAAGRVLTGQYNPANGIGLANTSVAFFGDRLYALGESDLPYSIRLAPNGEIETLGRQDFDGNLFMSMTAHPKSDPDTGETFAFRYGPLPPFLTFFRFDKNGAKQSDVPIFSMNRPSFLHDFAITQKYAVFTEIQIGFNPMLMIMEGRSPVGTDPSTVSRVGLIPRYANDESKMKWFDVPGFNLIHAINAWDEDDAVVLLAPNILSVEHTLERMDLVHALIEEKNRFVYAGVGDPMPKISGVVKLDVSQEERRDCIVASRIFGPGCYGGEPFFVPRERESSDETALEEDDGYVVSYVHDENSGESKFIVMDAKSPKLEIIAVVKLPRRVPYGFHGLFVKESDLNKL